MVVRDGGSMTAPFSHGWQLTLPFPGTAFGQSFKQQHFWDSMGPQELSVPFVRGQTIRSRSVPCSLGTIYQWPLAYQPSLRPVSHPSAALRPYPGYVHPGTPVPVDTQVHAISGTFVQPANWVLIGPVIAFTHLRTPHTSVPSQGKTGLPLLPGLGGAKANDTLRIYNAL